LRKAQLEIAELKEELRAQKMKYAELKQNYKALKTKARKEKSTSNGMEPESTPVDNDGLILLYACRFGVMNKIFVPKDLFLQPRPLGVKFADHDWWDDDEKEKLCMIAELYKDIPKSLHEMEKTSIFSDMVQCPI
jgi:hypothetical protein